METEKIEALFMLDENIYGKRKRTTIVITEDGDEVVVGVKALCRVFAKNEEGSFNISQQQYGDFVNLNKSAPISCLFEKLKELFDSIPEIIEQTGEKA